MNFEFYLGTNSLDFPNRFLTTTFISFYFFLLVLFLLLQQVSIVILLNMMQFFSAPSFIDPMYTCLAIKKPKCFERIQNESFDRGETIVKG